ncbi:MAG: hypothetical protein ACTSWV_04085 [Candidatus Asgardarchaeia archaeon]
MLKPLIGSVLAYWKTRSDVVQSEAEDWVASLGLLEAEETVIEADNTLSWLILYFFSAVPSVTCSLYHKLAGYMILVHERPIGCFVELPTTPDAVRSFKGILHDAEKGSVGFSEETLLNFVGSRTFKTRHFLM